MNQRPARVLGQTQLTLSSVNPNLVEGRELFAPGGIAADTSVNPPILYVSDTGNNRVLAWKNASSFQNGQKADLVLGQPDMLTTFRQGPGTSYSVGFSSPTGLAVDKSGNLYVTDSGNNRVLRFPAPFGQTNHLPDMVIGQTNFTTSTTNTGGGVTANTVALASGTTILPGGLAFDNQGNLWLADAGNRRVLRYPASALAAAQNGPAADLVLGQTDFVSVATAPSGSTGVLSKTGIGLPGGLAFDAAGNLYVTDQNLGRVLVYFGPLQSGLPAARILGVFVRTGTLPPDPIKQGTIGLDSPTGVLMVNGNPAVVDTYASRILIYPPLSQWAPESQASPSPAATTVIGQFGNFAVTPLNSNNSVASSLNGGRPTAVAGTLAFPSSALMIGSELFIVDTGNHRVVVWPTQDGSSSSGASRVLGQNNFQSNSINLIEGREFNFVRSANPSGSTNTALLDARVLVDQKISAVTASAADAGMALDETNAANPPHLYIADPFNNRVVAYKDWRSAKAGASFDLVIGQPDAGTAECNYPSNNPDQPTQGGLCRPSGVAVDSAGNLWVADSGNGRVVRFPSPFGQGGQPDLVLGQSSFTSKITLASNSTMAYPYGLAFDGDNGLLVSDPALNRVLLFPASGGAYTSSEPASKVFGQPDFSSTGTAASSNPEDNRLNGPHHVARDTSGRLYVADTNSSRIVIFPTVSDPATSATDAHAAAVLSGLARNPRGVYVSPQTGEIWVADSQNSRIDHYPQFDNLPATNYASDFQIPANTNTLAVAADQYGDLFVADVGSRITIYFPGVTVVNGASFLLNRALAPGVWASICPVPTSSKACQPSDPNQFGSQTPVLANQVPLPTSLSDISVLVAGQPAPVYYVNPRQINFLMPSTAPTSGTVDIQVQQNSTGRILGSGQASMTSVSPALFAADGSGAGQLAVLNQDNTVNSTSNAAPHGTVIQLFGTGAGALSGGPADGAPASGQVSTSDTPQVFINTGYVTSDAIQYSGLAPGLIGVWQINVKIPDTVPPSNQTVLYVQYKSVASIQQGVRTTIATK